MYVLDNNLKLLRINYGRFSWLFSEKKDIAQLQCQFFLRHLASNARSSFAAIYSIQRREGDGPRTKLYSYTVAR